jgi:phytoene synthase
MNNFDIYNNVSAATSKLITFRYSTSFTMGIKMMNKKYHEPIFFFFFFVRMADEIVDTFHGYDKEKLLNKFKSDTYAAIEEGISLNPVLHSFQQVVKKYAIDPYLINTFLKSMETDLATVVHDTTSYDEYILGSAEVVGLMCLKVFCNGDEKTYQQLTPFAMKLGAAFQKINFLRDANTDFNELGRTYFPGINISQLSLQQKKEIEKNIEADFLMALQGIKHLPRGARSGVYIAYIYYYSLFKKIKSITPQQILKERIRVHDSVKYLLLIRTFFSNTLNLI